MKRIHLIVEDKVFKDWKKMKDETGYSWHDFFSYLIENEKEEER